MRYFVTILVILSCGITSAYSITVEEAVDLALRQNPDLQAWRTEESIALGKLGKARLPFSSNPTLESYVSRKERPENDSGSAYTNYGVKIAQEFEIAGQRSSRIAVAENELAQIKAGIKDKERVLITDVKDAFARSLALKKKIALAEKIVQLKKEFLGYTKIKFQSGDVSALDVNLAEVELSKAKKDLLLLQRDYRESLLVLQGFIGESPNLTLPLHGELASELPVLPDKKSLKDFALSKRPDAKAAVSEVEKTKASLSLIKKEAIPNISLSGFYDRDELRNITGVGISIPLPFFDRKQAEKKEAVARAESARVRSNGLKQAIEREVEQAFSELAAANEELTLFQREIIAKTGENLNLLNLAFKEGKVGFFEVRLAQKDTIEAQFAYIDAQIRTQLAINALERTTGRRLK